MRRLPLRCRRCCRRECARGRRDCVLRRTRDCCWSSQRQFVQVGLAEHEGAGAAQCGDHGCVLRRAKVPQRRRAGGRRIVPGIDAVFHRNGKTEQSPGFYTRETLAIAGSGILEHSRRIQGDECIQGLRGLTSRQQGLRIFFRADRTLRHVSDRVHRAQVDQVRRRAAGCRSRSRCRPGKRRPPTSPPWRWCPARRRAARFQWDRARSRLSA